MSPIWHAPVATTVQIVSSTGELAQIRPVHPEFWNHEGNIEIGKYVEDHEAYLAKHRSEQKVLYHYTGLDALHGIVMGGEIWASDVRQLNDRAELTYALEAMYRASEEIWGAGKNHQPLDAIFRPGRIWQFASCFSHSRDQLSQWRAYGKKVGVAVAFDRDHLTNAVAKSGGRLVDCEYLDPADFSRLRERIEPILTDVRKSGVLNADGALIDMRVQDEAIGRVVQIAATIKHPSFREEHESRIVFGASSVDAKMQFRSSSDSLVPYMKVDIDGRRFGGKRQKYANDLGILEVTVWPSNVDNQVLDSIDMLLGRAGNALINRSSSPYRT